MAAIQCNHAPQVTQGQVTLPHTPWPFLGPYIAHGQCNAVLCETLTTHTTTPTSCSFSHNDMSTGSNISKACFAGDLGTGLARPALSLQQHHTAQDLSTV